MMIWSNFMLVIGLGAVGFQAPTPPPTTLSQAGATANLTSAKYAIDVVACWIDPAWRKSPWAVSMKELSRQGGAVVWSADDATIQAMLKSCSEDHYGHFQAVPRVMTTDGSIARVDQARRAPQSLAIRKFTRTLNPPGQDQGQTTLIEMGLVELGFRMNLIARTMPNGGVRLETAIEDSFLKTSVETYVGEIDAAKRPQSAIDCVVVKPEKIRQTVQGAWNLAKDGQLVVSFGNQPDNDDLKNNPFQTRVREGLLIVAPRRIDDASTAKPNIAPLASATTRMPPPPLAPVPAAKPSTLPLPSPSPVSAMDSNVTNVARRDQDLTKVKVDGMFKTPTATQTPVNENSNELVVRAYSVSDLMPRGGLASISRKVFEKVSPQTWLTPSSPSAARTGTISLFPANNSLIIKQTPRVHREIDEKMRLWRAMRDEGVSLDTMFAPTLNPVP